MSIPMSLFYSSSASFRRLLKGYVAAIGLGVVMALPTPAGAQIALVPPPTSGTATAAAESFRQPAFPGGPAELAKFLSRNLQYPAEAADARVSGRVMVTFWVDEAGKPYGFGAVQSPHPSLEAEALRVARKITHWEPGLQEGKPAPMQMYLPVVFKLMER